MPLSYFQIVVRHAGLNRYRVLSGTDWYTVNLKAKRQYEAWEREWQEYQAAQRARASEVSRRADEARQRKRNAQRSALIEQCASWAKRQTDEARAAIEAVRGTLARSLDVNDAIDWKALEDRSEFPIPRPVLDKVAPPPEVPSPGDAPSEDDPQYKPSLGIAGRLSASRRRRKTEEARRRYEEDLAKWAALVRDARNRREVFQERYQAGLRSAEQAYNRKLDIWRAEQQKFLDAQSERNETLRARRLAYEANESSAIVDYCGMVLARSDYPDSYPRDADVVYRADDRTAVVDLTMPPLDAVPDVAGVSFDSSAMDYVVDRLSEEEHRGLHQELLRQMAVRTIHELFEADTVGALDSVVVNGWLGSGITSRPYVCVLSVRAEKRLFRELDLRRDGVSECYRTLELVGFDHPSSSAPVEPLAIGARREDQARPVPSAAASVYGGDRVSDLTPMEFERLLRVLLERDVCDPGEQVLLARLESQNQVRAMVVDEKTRRIVRFVVHAHVSSDELDRNAVAELQSAMAAERASGGMLISTGPVSEDARAAAAEAGLTVVDGVTLLALLSRHGASSADDARRTNPLTRETSELND